MGVIDYMEAAGARWWGRRLSRLLVLVLLLTPSGCIVFAATTVAGAAGGAAVASSTEQRRGPRMLQTSAGSFPRGASVSIALDPARDVVVVGPRASDTTLVQGAHTLIGQLMAARGDTLFIVLSSATLAGADRATFPRGRAPTAALVLSPTSAVRVIAARPGATERATFAAIAGSALAVALLVGIIRGMTSGT